MRLFHLYMQPFLLSINVISMKGSLKIIQRLNNKAKDGTCPICLRYTSYRRVTYIGLNNQLTPNIGVTTRKWYLLDIRIIYSITKLLKNSILKLK